ncbi:MAG: tRNA uridine-5-carboxymethylaminomethyl(34) synthesis GTPase MnmE, partial [Candidatus Omnitrophica bacterium]|nr:tRNA uridine-5-carboxymethylaminomethyl(34) synthesis GTPase MnmE [Candidatus Omnitrophota bacterium]
MDAIAHLEDTIVAISTPLGQGGIGIVRLSGKDAVPIADRMFLSKSRERPSRFKSFTVHYGDVARGTELIDEALVTVMRAPRSYTREDVVEISSHGGVTSLRAVLRLAVDLGARPADPGEFTKRAFLNGRIDLAQAEAVLDTIQAKTEAFLKVSAHQLKGELSTELERVREELMGVYVAVEAVVNFPEDDTEAQGRCAAALAGKIRQAHQKVDRLLASGEHGRVLKEGIKIVLCGKPNVGKSSLLNVLLKQPRAIVSPVAGTTRDTIEETAQIQGIPFQLVDTAGIVEPRDLIEEEAVRRSHVHIHGADLVLLILDASVPLNDEDQKLVDAVRGQNFLIVFNKCDLQTKADEKKIQAVFPRVKSVRVSALKKEGIRELEDAVVERVWHGQMTDTEGVLVSNMRHIRALRECLAAVQKAAETLAGGLSPEFVSEEIKRA